jgi:PPM family protein phosphatase
MIILVSYSEKGDHAVNEDVFDVRRHPADPDCWLCFVADGQGGRAGGERAARLACQAGADAALGLPPATLARPKTWIDVLQKADKTVNRDPEAGFTTLIGFCLTSDRLTGASCGDSALVASSANKRLQNLTDRQAKDPPVGSGFAQFVPFANKLAYPWTVLAMSDGVWKYVGWDRLIAAAGNHRAQPLIDALKSAARLRSGCFPDDFTVVVFEGMGQQPPVVGSAHL